MEVDTAKRLIDALEAARRIRQFTSGKFLRLKAIKIELRSWPDES